MNRIRSSVFSLLLLGLFATSSSAWGQAQARDVSGRVTIAGTGQPLPDAVVAVAGQSVGTRTNERGEFRLRIPGGDVTIFARAVGYKREPKTIPSGAASADV
mgnify:CR=1 FL=1